MDATTVMHGRAAPLASRGLVPAALVAASAPLLFAVQTPIGYATLALGVGLAALIDRVLARDLLLIAVSLALISSISLEADISPANMLLMGVVLAAAVAVPALVNRLVFGDRQIRFPLRRGRRWSRLERWWLVMVVVLGWLILPFYFIGSGAYLNWPAVEAPDEIARLFIGVNAVGIWDELFFICVVFALFRRHFAMPTANVLQAVVFVSFLWELGYRSWGPLLTIPFALVQGWIFSRTRSLTYVVCVHLLFDLVVFLVLLHAHHREWLPIFLL